MLPMRCFTCNMPLSGLEGALLALRRRGLSRLRCYELVGLDRPCCRAAEMATIPHEHNQQQTRQNLGEFSEGRVRMETAHKTSTPRVYSTD